MPSIRSCHRRASASKVRRTSSTVHSYSIPAELSVIRSWRTSSPRDSRRSQLSAPTARTSVSSSFITTLPCVRMHRNMPSTVCSIVRSVSCQRVIRKRLRLLIDHVESLPVHAHRIASCSSRFGSPARSSEGTGSMASTAAGAFANSEPSNEAASIHVDSTSGGGTAASVAGTGSSTGTGAWTGTGCATATEMPADPRTITATAERATLARGRLQFRMDTILLSSCEGFTKGSARTFGGGR